MNKVKITYAVDLDKVPHKSQELITEAYYWLSGALSSLEQIQLDNEEESFQKALEQVDKIRRALADVDQRLDDCIAVMSGYHKTMIDLSAPVQESPAQHGPQIHGDFGESTAALTEQLEALQKQMSIPIGEDNE